MRKFLLSFLVLSLFQITTQAQTLKFTVNNLPDTTVYLARYFGKKLYYADTAKVQNQVFTFDGSKHESGLYAAIMPGQKYFEFIIDNNEKVEMQVKDQQDMIGSMQIKKSENNLLFYNYIRFMTENKKLAADLSKKLEATKDEAEKESLTNQLKGLNEKVLTFQRELAEKNKELFVGKMVGMSLDIELPEAPRDENGAMLDSAYLYKYNVAHYWDNVDLKDASIVRTPVFDNKLEKYFSNQVMLQIPDSIVKYVDNLVAKTDPTSVVFQYIVHFVTNKYERSDLMGMDAVFVHMADTYYCPANDTKAFWMSAEGLDKVCERADKLRPLLLGQYAPRLILTDTTEQNWIDFYKITAEYKVLYFWDPNCGHCKKVTPKLETLYEQKLKDRGVEVIAIGKATGDDFEDWKAFIVKNHLSFYNIGLTKNIYNQAQKDARAYIPQYTTLESLNYTSTYDIYSTPRIFLLDKDNKIIYKQLSLAQLEEILDRLQGFEDAEKLFPVDQESDDDHQMAH